MVPVAARAANVANINFIVENAPKALVLIHWGKPHDNAYHYTVELDVSAKDVIHVSHVSHL